MRFLGGARKGDRLNGATAGQRPLRSIHEMSTMHIVIINNIPRYADPARWDFKLIRYEDEIDHKLHQVSYIVNPRGRSGVTAPAGSYQLYTLDTLSDAALYRPLLDRLVRERGPIDRLVVFSESLQDVAAELRDQFGIPGNGVEANRLGRDKLVMKQRIAAAGLRAPRFTAVTADGSDAALAFAAATGYPLILKPVDGQASSGVRKIADERSLRAELASLPDGVTLDLEEFIEGTLFHVDGLIDSAGQVVFIVPSQYVNPCLDFTQGAPLGAAMLDPSTPLHAEVRAFATACVQALGLKGGPFHLELFRTEAGELVFLEVGARVGGADVPYIIHQASGINLFDEWLRIIVGKEPQPMPAPALIGAWLMFPRPAMLPARVESVSRFDGEVGSLYRQLVPACGDVLENEDGYSSMQAGRFLFCSRSAQEVSRDMATIMRDFSLVTTQP